MSRQIRNYSRRNNYNNITRNNNNNNNITRNNNNNNNITRKYYNDKKKDFIVDKNYVMREVDGSVVELFEGKYYEIKCVTVSQVLFIPREDLNQAQKPNNAVVPVSNNPIYTMPEYDPIKSQYAQFDNQMPHQSPSSSFIPDQFSGDMMKLLDFLRQISSIRMNVNFNRGGNVPEKPSSAIQSSDSSKIQEVEECEECEIFYDCEDESPEDDFCF